MREKKAIKIFVFFNERLGGNLASEGRTEECVCLLHFQMRYYYYYYYCLNQHYYSELDCRYSQISL